MKGVPKNVPKWFQNEARTVFLRVINRVGQVVSMDLLTLRYVLKGMVADVTYDTLDSIDTI